MKITNMVSELEMEMRESQNQRDKRVEELWKKLDPQGTKELDLRGLQRGLRRIDHRKRSRPAALFLLLLSAPGHLLMRRQIALKNAGDMLKEILKTVDTSGDGKIQYEGRLHRACGEPSPSGIQQLADR